MRALLLIYFAFAMATQAAGPRNSTCEATLAYLEGSGLITPAVQAEIEGLRNGTGLLKGERLDVIRRQDRQEEVVGRVDRAVVHRHGFLHRTVIAFVLVPWPGEAEPRLLIQEFYVADPKGEVFIVGGHVQSEGNYKESMHRELLEELGFPLDTILAGALTQIGDDGDFSLSTDGGNNQERVSIFIYRTSDAERDFLIANAAALKNKREELGKEDFLAWLASQQKDEEGNSTGLGEVQSIQFVKFEEVEAALERDDWRLPSGLSLHHELVLHLRDPRVAVALKGALAL